MTYRYTPLTPVDYTYHGYDKAEFFPDVDDLNVQEEEIPITDNDGYESYIVETTMIDTDGLTIVGKEVEVEIFEPDYLYERDQEYDRVLGMYADEYATEINMVDSIDTESEFPWDTY